MTTPIVLANDDVAYATDVTAKRAKVRRMQVIASALLLAMLTVFALCAAFEPVYPALRWVQAFAEAAAVGALADWFAVTALFRHPLGLPIPHTAIIPRNKDRIGASLGTFVEYNFLTPKNVIGRLATQNPARIAALWLARPVNSESVARRACAMVPQILEAFDDDDVRRFFERALVPQLDRFDIARLAGLILGVLTAHDRHQGALDQALKALEGWLDANRARIKEKFSAASKYTPRFVDAYIVARFVDGVIDLLQEIASNPQHEIRKEFDEATRRFVDALQTSPEYQARGAALKREFLGYLQGQNYYRDAWSVLKGHLARDLEGEDSLFVANVASALGAVAGALCDDEALQRKLNGWLLRGVERLMVDHRHQISRLINDVVKSWDARQVSEKVELEIGKDLQYIRINGTLVGGTVGVVLQALTRLLA
jgi:uncharacterized membrane-anchored protein YjiN (DUF445 family)